MGLMGCSWDSKMSCNASPYVVSAGLLRALSERFGRLPCALGEIEAIALGVH